MRATISSATNAPTQPCPMDRFVTPFNAAVQAVCGGTSVWTLQITQSDPYAAYPVSFASSATWIDFVTGISGTAGITLTAPCTAIRMSPTTFTSGNSVTATVVQTGPVA